MSVSTWIRISFLVFCLMISACGVPNPSGSELDVIATARDESYSFGSAATYALPTQVQTIQDPNNPNSTISVSSTLNDLILQTVAQNMNSRGYQQLTDTSGPKPDVFIQTSVMASTSTEVYYSSWYTYWGVPYGAWYGGTYGVGYSPYSYPYVYTSTLGSLILDMTNPNAPDTQQKKIPSVWVGVMNGLISDSGSAEIGTRVVDGINQAFTQSPYIQKSVP